MLPLFPLFKNIELSDKSDIENITGKFPPYSDYYFHSLWSYDTRQQMSFSVLNDNLVVRFQEYTGDGFFYSFLGDNQILRTSIELINYAEHEGVLGILKLIPEHNFLHEPIDTLQKHLEICEDPDNHDYLLSVDEVHNLNGPRLHQKKKSLNKFIHTYNHEIKFLTLDDISTHHEIQSVIDIWYTQTTVEEAKNETELIAIHRTLENAQKFNLKMVAVYIDGMMRGFTIFEAIGGTHIVSSFQKADKRFFGIFEKLNQAVAEYAKRINIKYINIEQDLGLVGLRHAKRRYNPQYLKKYIIKRKVTK